MFLAITALPPVPSIMAMPIMTLITGNTMFTADSASVPIIFDINTPSTIWYTDMNTIIIMVGIVNFIILLKFIFLIRFVSIFYFSNVYVS